MSRPWSPTWRGVVGTSLVIFIAAVACEASAPLTVVDMGWKVQGTDVPTQIAVQACAGLFNRAAGTPVYVLYDAQDVTLLRSVAGVTTPITTTSIPAFLARCLSQESGIPRTIRYNYTQQQAIVPNLITLAAVLQAIPLEADNPAGQEVPVVFDAVKEFGDLPAANVTAFVYDRYAHATSTMAIMDPGYDQADGGIFNPTLNGAPDTRLMDYIVKESLFNFYLVEACVPLTPDHALMQRMVAEDGTDPWPRPIPTYGYNDVDKLFGGDLFEAETNCVSQHDMGQIASDTASNLAFFSRGPPLSQPLQQVPTPDVTYNATKSYVTLVVGDGDNIGMVMGARFEWMTSRVKRCAHRADGARCYPLVWTLSPQALHLAPNLTRWFYHQAHQTGADYFILPPSGDLYAYPGMMDAADQARFVNNTQRVARIMNTSGTVDWEWFLTWEHAFNTFFPLYAAEEIVRGVFAVCVPFMLPVLPFLGKHDTYAVIPGNSPSGGNVVVFQPREWRGTGNTTIPLAQREYYSPTQMAAELNGNPRGTVSYIYLTSDGGANLTQFDNLVELLDEHVEVVDHETIVQMALQRTKSLA